MSHLTVVRHPPQILAAFPWLADCLQVARELLEGPQERVQSSSARRRAMRWRPLEVAISEELILKTRISIPRSALGDLAHAVDLLIRRETPFEPDEMLLHAQQTASRDADQLTFVIRMLPRARVTAVFSTLGVRSGQVSRLTVEDAGTVRTEIDLSRGLRRRTDFAGLLSAAAIALCLVAGTYLWWSELDVRTRQIALMQTEVAAVSSQLALAARELDRKRPKGDLFDATTVLFEPGNSAFVRLMALAEALPPQVEVSRLELDGKRLRLTIRSIDILADIQSMNIISPGTTVLDGPLTADPATGLELATITVSPFQPVQR
jgi:hypothetical protein